MSHSQGAIASHQQITTDSKLHSSFDAECDPASDHSHNETIAFLKDLKHKEMNKLGHLMYTSYSIGRKILTLNNSIRAPLHDDILIQLQIIDKIDEKITKLLTNDNTFKAEIASIDHTVDNYYLRLAAAAAHFANLKLIAIIDGAELSKENSKFIVSAQFYTWQEFIATAIGAAYVKFYEIPDICLVEVGKHYIKFAGISNIFVPANWVEFKKLWAVEAFRNYLLS